jgi:hypothetical protein
VDDEILMRGIDGAADVDEQAQARRDVEPVTIAVGGDRQTVDVLHHEIRKLPFSRAAVEQLRDVRMTERGEDLPLGDEAPMELLGIGAVAQELDRDLTAILAVNAFGEIHHAHAAATKFAHDAVRADAPIAERFLGERRRRRGQAPFENPNGRLVRGEERLDLGVQLGIAPAAVAQPRATQRGIEIERVLEDFLDLGAARG